MGDCPSQAVTARWVPLLRAALALLFLLSGVLHLALPGPYLAIMPLYLPTHALLVTVSGWAEIAGAVGLMLASTRRAAGIGLILLLVAVFPANVEMLRAHREHGGAWPGEVMLWLRLPLQAVLMWAVWRVRRPNVQAIRNAPLASQRTRVVGRPRSADADVTPPGP